MIGRYVTHDSISPDLSFLDEEMNFGSRTYSRALGRFNKKAAQA